MTGVTASGLPDGFTFTATASGSRTDAGTGESTVASWSVFAPDGTDVSSCYEVSLVPGTLTVNQAPVTISTAEAKKVFDGTPLTAGEPTVTGLIGGDTITAAVKEGTGSVLTVGTRTPEITYTWGKGTDSGNYTVITNPGTLTVTANSTPITFTAKSAEKVYDGSPLEESDVTVTGVPSGFFGYGVTLGSITDAGSADNEITGYAIWAEGKAYEATACFSNVTLVKGTLKVTPKGISVSTPNSSKKYNGNSLPETTEEPTVSGLVEGETATVEMTGRLTDVGTGTNTYTINWGTAKEGNYEVVFESLGTLEVTKADLTITSGSATKPYDGTPLTSAEYSAEGLASIDHITVTPTGSQTNAGYSENPFTFEWDSTNRENYNTPVLIFGTLTVEKADLIIQTGSVHAYYRPTLASFTSSHYTVTGLAPNETITVECTCGYDVHTLGAGSIDHPYTLEWGTAGPDNYNVISDLGKLSCSKNQIIIDLGGKTVKYTGDMGTIAYDEPTARLGDSFYRGDLPLTLVSGSGNTREYSCTASLESGRPRHEDGITVSFTLTVSYAGIQNKPGSYTITATPVGDGTTSTYFNFSLSGAGFIIEE